MKEHKKNKGTALVISLGLMIVMVISSFTGCGTLKNEMLDAMNKKENIHMSVANIGEDKDTEDVQWIELDQLTTYPDLRNKFDDAFNITRFDKSSKNGCIYVDTDGNWCGNSTLYNAFMNKVFVEDHWNDSNNQHEIAEVAKKEFSDISSDYTGFMAATNVYFNLMPVNKDGTSGMNNNISRKVAMSVLYKADNSVMLKDTDSKFSEAVGNSGSSGSGTENVGTEAVESTENNGDVTENNVSDTGVNEVGNEVNEYDSTAQESEQYCYLQTDDGSLNGITYNETMSKAELIYALVNKYYSDELKSYSGNEEFTDCKNAGNLIEKLGFNGKYGCKSFTLEYALQNKDNGLPSDMFNAMCIAKEHGIIEDETDWNEGVTGEYLIDKITKTYISLCEKKFLVSANAGANTGVNLIDKELEEEKKKDQEELGAITVKKESDIDTIDGLLDKYGDEIDVSDKELEEDKKAAKGVDLDSIDKYMWVDNCYYLNIRVGPGTEYRIVKSVPKGTKVHVVGKCKDSDWYRMICDGKICYQYGIYLSNKKS